MEDEQVVEKKAPTNRPKKVTALALQTEEPSQSEDELSEQLRDLEKFSVAFDEKFSFAPDVTERLKGITARIIAATRMSEARHRAEHLQVRAKLGALTNGNIERWIALSGDEDLVKFFRRIWRPRSGQKGQKGNIV